jgi:hypothetical protein
MADDAALPPIDAAPRGWPAVVDATAGRAAAALVGAASFIRGRRIFHPHGAAFVATLAIEPGRSHGAHLLDEAGPRACTVRLSRAIGLPEGTADIWGVAIRVDQAVRGGADGPGAPEVQDLLFASVRDDDAIGRHVLVRSPSFGHRPLSTILPYRTRTGLVTLSLQAQATARGLSTLQASADAFEAGRLAFTLRVTPVGEETSRVGELTADRRLSQQEADGLRFNPFHAADDLQPAGAVNALRRRAYGASQAGRGHRGWAAEAARS